MKKSTLVIEIRKKKSFLCLGLDPDIEKMPHHLSKDVKGIKKFCLEIIESTKDYCVAYKPNSAFFEALGWQGLKVLEEVILAIPKTHFIILDAKRGDIGNTSRMYAKACFETMKADAITVAPYMGEDSVRPFLEFKDKWAIILGLTSNDGSKDFELKKTEGKDLFEVVLEECAKWGNAENTMFVIGATQGQYMKRVRQIVPNHFLLVPGIGAQGGSFEDVCNHLMNDEIGILINASREIIYASSETDYAEKAGQKARALALKMSSWVL
ncbi:MAG: orotidine-5'-phosphate decarboxylase [Chitinophagales bacterium]